MGITHSYLKAETTRKVGGVGIYVKSNLTVKHLPEFSIFADRIFETIFVESHFLIIQNTQLEAFIGLVLRTLL